MRRQIPSAATVLQLPVKGTLHAFPDSFTQLENMFRDGEWAILAEGAIVDDVPIVPGPPLEHNRTG